MVCVDCAPQVYRRALQTRGGSPGALCTSCETARPVRSKHCPMCDRCVLRFDHHCPWLSNCVGAGNYKLYMLCVIGVVVMLGFYLALATTCVVGRRGASEPEGRHTPFAGSRAPPDAWCAVQVLHHRGAPRVRRGGLWAGGAPSGGCCGWAGAMRVV